MEITIILTAEEWNAVIDALGTSDDWPNNNLPNLRHLIAEQLDDQT